MKNEENIEKKVQLKNGSPLYYEDNKLFNGEVFYFNNKSKKSSTNKENKKIYSELNLATKPSYNSKLITKIAKRFVFIILATSIYTNLFNLYLASQNQTQNIQTDFDVDHTFDDDDELETDENRQIIVDVSTDEEKEQILQKLKDLIMRDSANYGQNFVSIKKVISIDQILMKDIAIDNTFDNYLISIKFETINNEIYDMQFYADAPFELSDESSTSLDKISELIKYLNDPNKTAIFGYTKETQTREEIKNLVEKKLNKELLFVGEMFYYTKNSGDFVYKMPLYYLDENGQINTLLYSTSINSTFEIIAQGLDPEHALLAQLNGEGEEYFIEESSTNNTSFNSINKVISSYNEALSQTEKTNVYLDNKKIYEIKNKQIIKVDHDEKE